MKRLLLTLVFAASLFGVAQGQVQQLVDFDNTSDLLTLFNPSSNPEFTNIADQGIGNTGSIDVPLGSYDIWTTKVGYTVAGEGDVYTLSAFFKIAANSGYGGLGLTPNDQNESDEYGSPVHGLGMAFHGGGGMFVNNQDLTDVYWPPDLVIGNWYKMILKVTAKGSNTYDMDFQIWNSDANGTLGVMKTEQTLNDVFNAEVGGASTLHVYFSAAGDRMEKIDNFDINLEGGAVFVEAGAPVVLTDDASAIATTTATCGGNVTDDQGSAVTTRGVCWSTTAEPTTLDAHTSDDSGIGPFTSSLTGLAAGTSYYARAYATNGVGTSYGSEVSFMTQIAAVSPNGVGSAGDPYQIATLSNLYWISQNTAEWNKHYIQTQNINASATSTLDGGAGWTPIGNSVTKFTGAYDGNGKTISGIYINRPSGDYQGLFGYISGGIVSNLGAIGLDITARSLVGGLAGVIDIGTTITACYSTGSLDGNITTTNIIGGLVGDNLGNVSNCYSTTSVTGWVSVGGLVGGNEGSLSNSYATGSVSGAQRVGGLVGLSFGAGAATSYCYSTGSATGSIAGGLVGTRINATVPSNSFWDTQTSGNATSDGGTGKTTAEMKTQSTFTGAGWDAAVWNMDAGINNGYPYLQWQNPGGTSLPIQLASFTAAYVNNAVDLHWATISEINNYGFHVQRTANTDSAWVELPNSFIPGHGTTLEPQHYSFTDATVNSGSWLYRLRQIDLDGSVHFTDPVQVSVTTGVGEELPLVFSLSQNYPNPFNPSTQIRYSVTQSEWTTLKVYNMIGQEVATLVQAVVPAGEYSVHFDASKLASGMYFYRLTAGAQVVTQRMILMK